MNMLCTSSWLEKQNFIMGYDARNRYLSSVQLLQYVANAGNPLECVRATTLDT